MLTFAAGLVLPFLAVRALAVRAADGWAWVLRWAAALAARLVAVVRERAWGSFEAATAAAVLTAACWGHTRGEVERMWQFLVPFAVVVAVRQLLRWRASLPLVAVLLLGQAVAIQVLFYTRW